MSDFAGDTTTVPFDRTSSLVEDAALDSADTSEESIDGAQASSVHSPPAREREGLPAGFRMRHDAHYVDELTKRTQEPAAHLRGDYLPAASIVPAANIAPAASIVPAANIVPANIVRGGEAADWALVSRLEALEVQVESATHRGFRSAASVEAFRMELARATRIAKAAAIVSGTAHLNRRSCTAAEIAERLVKDTRWACRAAGVQLDSVVEAPAFVVPVDFALISQVLAGSVDATLAQLEEARGLDVAEGPDAPRLTLKLSAVTTRPALFIELTQDACSLAPEAVARFFDAGFDRHAGGPSTGVLLSAAARIVRLHGGRADVRRDGDVGSTITFILPQALPASAKDAD